MKVPVSWMRDFVPVPAEAGVVANRLGACGFAVESVDADVIDFEITANRPDCLSVYGLAREASAAFDLHLAPPATASAVVADVRAPVTVSIADAGCGRYALAVLGVTVGPSPGWLAARLAAVGIRPINNVVDVTNYVMLETGHPMHAFDLAKLAGPEIRVRRARDKEAIVTIDGERRTLDETMLVIADREHAVAVAGVMGGASSEISTGTTTVALESAWFLPNSVRATSKKLGLKTEASMRFERGADIEAPARVLGRAIALLQETAHGTIDGGITDVYPRPFEARRVTLGRERLSRVLGVTIPDADIERLLTALGFSLDRTGGGWRALVPSFRIDVHREADLVEEVGRHWGFDRIPATFPALSAVPRASDAVLGTGRLTRRILSGAGLQEAVTFTFIEAQAAAPFAAVTTLLPIKNPLSEKFAVLRPSLVPGLLEALVYNQNRQATDVRLFELGSVFSKDAGERAAVAWVLTGSRGEHWSGSAGSIEFTDTKGIAELVARAFGVGIDARPAPDLAWLAPGAGAHLLAADGRPMGWIGRLAAVRGSDAEVYAGEIDLDRLGRAGETGTGALRALPRFPAVVRDLSILIDERLPAAEVRGTIRSHAPATLVAVGEFDRYRGKGVPPGRVSLSLRLTFQDAERTLTDADVQAGIDAIVAALAGAHGAELRGR